MSTNRRIYLDYNATAPLCDAAREAMSAALADAGNPSSIHAEGRRARDRVEQARAAVAALAGRPREQVVFTSGGTESNHLGVLALAAAAERRGLPRLVATTAIEHPSLRGAIAVLAQRGWEVRTLHPFADQLGEGVGLFAAAVVNHEVGSLLPAHFMAGARAHGALIHLDAVQAAGKLALADLPADALAISSHKIGGPQGAGGLAIAIDDGLPLVEAGHQERGRRPGTENVLGIVGFGAAARAIDLAPGAELAGYRQLASWEPVAALGDRLEAGALLLPAPIDLHAGGAPRVGGTINVGFRGARGQDVMIALDLAGVAVSTGAACTSGSVEPSPVLLGLGTPADQARSAVRFSLGRGTTADEIDEVLRVLPAIVARARAHG